MKEKPIELCAAIVTAGSVVGKKESEGPLRGGFDLFDETYSKMEIITVFMAILEMLKFQKIEVVQAERYADIKIKRKEVTDEP